MTYVGKLGASKAYGADSCWCRVRNHVSLGGTIMQARVSNVVRDAAYAIATAETLFKM